MINFFLQKNTLKKKSFTIIGTPVLNTWRCLPGKDDEPEHWAYFYNVS